MRSVIALALTGAIVMAVASCQRSRALTTPVAEVVARQEPVEPGLGPWVRLNDGRPILSPRGDGFEAAGVFNAAVVRRDSGFVMLYRA